jgi:hypothetical protein
LLTFESDWNPPMGEPLFEALRPGDGPKHLDLGCVAAHGIFHLDDEGFKIQLGGKPATAFLLKLIAQLQFSGTVPMIDVDAYARWLAE